jgi:16S rRNA (cytidine1402-2'-O)-methyltransferase
MKADKDSKKSALYMVATPIGNLEDITLRAVRILKEVHLIAAEDTRRTKILLRAYDIQTPLTSLYDQNEHRKSGFLIDKMKEGLDIAYVSDAGTPGVSDPGYVLIRAAIENNIRVVPVPGVSAVITALSVSGLPMDAFAFYGFLPAKPRRRKEVLQSIQDDEKTIIFYESPRRLLSSLHDMESVFGNRDVVVVREMTKVFEEILRGSLSQIIGALQERGIKGEITLIVAGKKKISPECSDEEIWDRYEQLRKDTALSRRDMITKFAGEIHVSRKRVYQVIHLLFS